MKILIVDNVFNNRFLLKEILHTHECIETENGKEALEIIRNNNIDLVLMDINMPVMDGVEATIKIRELYGENFPVICITGYNFNDISNFNAAKFTYFINKPFTESIINNLINKFK